ncbi:MAG: DUF1295 domain-containing protein [Candidatus Lokiarchaeota archaeon]|nr:DUF1295 domain-containing protein [Candidatus Lokiarchaeota archaeon]
MAKKKRNDLCEEAPHFHSIQIVMIVIYFTIFILDSLVFRFSTFLINYIHFSIPIILGSSLLVLGILLIYFSSKTVFGEVRDPPKVIEEGVFRYIRHPMYLGILLIYLSVAFFSFSIICMVSCVVIFLVYNGYASYEETQLEEMFKEEYLEYKKKSSKWIPLPH